MAPKPERRLYDKVQDYSDESEEFHLKDQSPISRQHGNWLVQNRPLLPWMLMAAASTTVAIICCITMGYWATTRHATGVDMVQHHCGNTVSEARILGCQFDILTNNWVPAACMDNTTAAEFREWAWDPTRLHKPWAYFHDQNATQHIATEEHLSELVGQTVYTTTENHVGHCVFLMRRVHRLASGELRQIPKLLFKHTVHCTSEMLKTIGKSEFEDRGTISSFFDVAIVDRCLRAV